MKHADGRGDQADHQQLRQVETEQIALRGTQAAQDGAHVEMPLAVASRRHRHRDPGEHDRRQYRETEVTFRPFQGRAHGPATLFHADQFVAGSQARLEPVPEFRQVGLAARKQVPVGQPAARLDHAGCRDIRQPDQETRRDTERIPDLAGFEGDHTGDGKRLGADLHGVAHLQAEGRKQARRRPGLPGPGQRLCLAIRGKRGRRGPQPAPQREAVLHRLHTGQLQVVAAHHHAGELEGLDRLQAGGPRCTEPGGVHRSRAGQGQVGAEKVR